MKLKHSRLLLATFLLLAIAFVSAHSRTPYTATLQKSEMRCGWFSNPTPANASLHDRDGEWIIGVQGGHQAEGDWPAFLGEAMDRDKRALWLWLRVSPGASGSRNGESNQN